ncbi:MAG: DUF1206 domain-containing protein [Thalassobaculaceae bacterium]|nr:DUF1206 domain-containing protein [Thalassobaculaceae bacterium]
MDRVRRLEAFSRIGFAAHGAVYLLVGWFAVRAALSIGSPTDARGALDSLVGGPFGWALLGVMALGLLCYALCGVAEAVFDLHEQGDTARGLAVRSGRIISALIHLALAVYAGALAVGLTLSGGSAKGWTAWLMSQPYGPWLVMAVGVGVFVVAMLQVRIAWTATFMEQLVISGDMRWLAEAIGRTGYLARATVLTLTCIFLLSAGWNVDSSQAGGLADALRQLQRQPYGPWMLGVVSVGLVMFGVSSFVEAAYRRLTGAF